MAQDWRKQLDRMIGPTGSGPDDPLDPEDHEGVVERRVEFGEGENWGHMGFHGREASEFVKLAKRHKANIRVSVGGDDWENAKRYGNARDGSIRGTADAKSIFGVSRFCGVLPGHPFILRAKGPDAEKAVKELGDALEFRHRF